MSNKTNNLKAYLRDLYEGIVSKKPDASRNPQNFRSEIEAIRTGGELYEVMDESELPDDAPDGSLALVEVEGGNDNSIVGTWTFNSKVTMPNPLPPEWYWLTDYTVVRDGEKLLLDRFYFGEDYFCFYNETPSQEVYLEDVYIEGEGWSAIDYRAITILKEPSAEVAAWIKANAKRGQPSVYELSSIDRLPDDAIDGSMAIVGEGDFYIRENGEWVLVCGTSDDEGVSIVNQIIERTATEIKDDTVEIVGEYAFYNYKNLASVDFPNLTTISSNAFYGCSKLALTSLPSGVTSISSYAFYGCSKLALTSLPSGLMSIGNDAFGSCSKLALTSLPSDVTIIGGSAFYGCSNLALTSLPSGVTGINGYTFQNCSNLALTSLPSGLMSIGSSAFKNCTGLTSITFEGTPTSINSTAFGGCTNLTTINVPWAEGAVANAPWGATNATINYNYTGG